MEKSVSGFLSGDHCSRILQQLALVCFGLSKTADDYHEVLSSCHRWKNVKQLVSIIARVLLLTGSQETLRKSVGF